MSGSSPHTRGAPTAPWLRCLPPWDHPRIRGEHGRVRGLDGLDLRIIPAYAGSTEFGDAAEGDVMGSSPHTRGALEEQLRKVAEEAGSSPHTRGAHLTTCATIPHSSILDSVIRVHSRTSTQPQPRRYPPNLLAARYLLALLHPVCGIPSIVASSVPGGLFINSTPSQSTGCQSG